MWRRSDYRSATLGWLAIAFVCMLGASSSALAIDPPSVNANHSSPSRATNWSFDFSATFDPLATTTGYEGGIVGVLPDDGPISPPFAANALGDGTYTFRVRAVQQGLLDPEPVRSDFSTVTFRVDTTPPNPPTATLVPASPNGTNGWYTSATVRWSCSDPSGASCPAQTISVAKRATVVSQVAVDGVGNVSAPGFSPAFNFDNGASQPAISSPSNGARVAGEPTFTWARITDPTSGNNRFEVYAHWAGVGDQLIASTPGTATATKRNVRTAPLPEGTLITWFVKFFDNAGNFRVAAPRTFTILPTPPSGIATITGGPAGPTRVNTPTFTWTGDQPAFSWDVTQAGAATTTQSGKGAARQVTLKALADGDYTFRVSQVTALNAEGPEVTQAFTVDTVRPAAPVITARPAAPTSVPAGFAWTTEAGAYSRWQVVGAGGAVVKGPSDSVAAAVNVGALASGAYTFRVAQVDPAGNVSDTTSEAFTVQLPAGTPAGGAPAAKRPVIALPKQNAGRLRPRAGRIIATLRPMFRWTKGPRGTTLYNLQIFQVTKREAGKAPTIVKVHTAFPRGTTYKLPRKVRAGQCYVWRVWPYAGSSFTPKPLGISNFCVASAKVLKRNIARAKARQRARHQAGGARVG